MDAGRFYREGSVSGASPISLVARLYEQMIQDIRQAMKAMDQKDIELRTSKINHAILVIGHLQSQLNLNAGGRVAETLRNFYDMLRRNLVSAQLQQSKPLLAQQITDLLAIREAWIEVERAQEIASVPGVAQASAATSATHEARKDWRG